jgi:hypothetical protein
MFLPSVKSGLAQKGADGPTANVANLGGEMRKFGLVYGAIALMVVLSGCIAGGGGAGGGQAGQAPDVRPLDMTAITAQPLGAVPSGPAAPQTGRVIGAPTPQALAPQATTAPAASTAPAQSAADIGAAAAAVLGTGGAAPAVSAPISPEQAACTQSGGRWGNAGDTGAQTCFRPAADAGKACSVQSDCSTQCLARSRSCAPFWPIFGCTEVVQNNGAVVRLCLE